MVLCVFLYILSKWGVTMLQKWMTIIALILVAVMTVCVVLYHSAYPQNHSLPLTERQKSDIEEACKATFLYGTGDPFLERFSINWIEGYGGEYGKLQDFRYFGTYDDCVVLIWYYENIHPGIGLPMEPPFKVFGLSRSVEYPVTATIVLYNTSPNYPNSSDPALYLRAPFATLSDLEYCGITWLTNAQLERLTTDLENWLAEGNY